MSEEFVIHQGVRMVKGWPEKIEAAQMQRSVTVAGAQQPRVRYGEDPSDRDADEQPCVDCGVRLGQFHVEPCSYERCRVCGNRLIACTSADRHTGIQKRAAGVKECATGCASTIKRGILPLVVLTEDEYWNLLKRYDTYLPDSVSVEEVAAELESIQRRFRESVAHLGDEGDAWDFPKHYQHVRVFYVYLYSQALYTPDLARAVQISLEGFDDWICELECDSIPGDAEFEGMRRPVYLKGRFYTERSDAPEAFAAALDLAIDTSAISSEE